MNDEEIVIEIKYLLDSLGSSNISLRMYIEYLISIRDEIDRLIIHHTR